MDRKSESEMRLPHATRRVLLVFLNHLNEKLYGYSVMLEAGLMSGTVYPILRRLERKGLLAGEWEKPSESSTPRRRVYVLTSMGREKILSLAPMLAEAPVPPDHSARAIERPSEDEA